MNLYSTQLTNKEFNEQCKTILCYFLIMNHLNYFKIITLKINKFITYDEL